MQRELQWVYDIAQKIHESELSYLYFMVGTHVQIYSMMSGKFFQIIVFYVSVFFVFRVFGCGGRFETDDSY